MSTCRTDITQCLVTSFTDVMTSLVVFDSGRWSAGVMYDVSCSDKLALSSGHAAEVSALWLRSRSCSVGDVEEECVWLLLVLVLVRSTCRNSSQVRTPRGRDLRPRVEQSIDVTGVAGCGVESRCRLY